jgi:hypothetical protein
VPERGKPETTMIELDTLDLRKPGKNDFFIPIPLLKIRVTK